MKIELAIMFLLIAALSTTWYFGFIKPADAARTEIMECMKSNDDLSYESYEVCVRNATPR